MFSEENSKEAEVKTAVKENEKPAPAPDGPIYSEAGEKVGFIKDGHYHMS